jgi:MFS family permease
MEATREKPLRSAAGRPDRCRGHRVRIYLASLLVDASTYSFSVGLSCHAESALGRGYWDLGKLGALSALCYSLTCLFTGGWSDRIGSLPLCFASLGLIALTFVYAMFASTFGHLLIAGAFMGISLALFWPAMQRKLSLLSPGSTLWGALGAFNVLWAVGVGLGTMSTPALYGGLGLRSTLLFGLVTALLAVPLLAARMDEPGRDGDWVPAPGVAPARARLFLRMSWIANFAAFFALVGVVRVFPRVSHDLGIEVRSMGWFLVPLDIGKIAAFAILWRMPFWHYSFRWLAGAQAAGGLALVASGLLQSSHIFLVLFPLVGAVSGLTYFSSIYYGLNLREGEGRKSGLHETILASGVCLGPLLCGLIGQAFPGHPGAALVFGGLVVLLGLAVQSAAYLGTRAGAGSRAEAAARGAREAVLAREARQEPVGDGARGRSRT